MILDSTTKKLQVVLAANVTTNQLQVDASWVDMTTTATTPGSTQALTNNTTDVDIVAAPAANTQRVIQSLSIFNADTVSATVTVKVDVSSTDTIKAKVTLQTGQSLVYTPGSGWQVPQGSLTGGNKASFRADKNGTDQTGIASGVATKVTLTTERFDNGSYYDSTDSKWTPPAGVVHVTAHLVVSGGVVAGNNYGVILYKNGSSVAQQIIVSPATSASISAVISYLDSANGTDYYEVYVYGDGAGTKTVYGGAVSTFFQGTAL